MIIKIKNEFENKSGTYHGKDRSKSNKKGEIRTCPKIVAHRLWRQRRELFSIQWEAAVVCCREFHQNRPTFIKLTCSARASRENKSLLWRQSRHISERLPDFSEYCFCHFYAFLYVFFFFEFEIWFSPVFFHHVTKIISGPRSTPFKVFIPVRPVMSDE